MSLVRYFCVSSDPWYSALVKSSDSVSRRYVSIAGLSIRLMAFPCVLLLFLKLLDSVSFALLYTA